jgi:hypothetical protein
MMIIKVRQPIFTVMLLLGLISLSVPATAQLPPPTDDVAHAFKKEKTYSPYAGRNFPTNAYFGDTHVHTGMSMDEKVPMVTVERAYTSPIWYTP